VHNALAASVQAWSALTLLPHPDTSSINRIARFSMAAIVHCDDTE
jgi:hypothetical protein